MATSLPKNRVVCFGSKRFILNSLTNPTNPYKIEKKTKAELENPYWDAINMPYWDDIHIDVSSLYDTLTKKFYCHLFGYIGNMGGDFYMNSEKILDGLMKIRQIYATHSAGIFRHTMATSIST